MVSASEASDVEMSPIKNGDDLGSSLKNKASRIERDTNKGRSEYAKLQKALDEEQKKNDEEDERTKQLINEKEDLIYEIKLLKKRKERLDKQNELFQKIVATDAPAFREKANELQDQLQVLLKEQKLRIEELGSQLRPVANGKEVETDTIGLAGSKAGTAQQQELQATLMKLENVLKAKAVNNFEPNIKSTKSTVSAAKTKTKKAPAKTKAPAAKPTPTKRTPGRKAAVAKSYAEGDDDEGQGDGPQAKKRSASIGSSRTSSKRRANLSDDDSN